MFAILRQHLPFAIRQLRRNPGFTLAAVITLSLGVGATTAIFSLLNGIVLTLLLVLVSVVSALIPALRAALIEPMHCLRTE